MGATQLADIDISSSSDSHYCWITASAMLSNNRLVAVDFRNKRIKLLYIHSDQLLSEFAFSSCPHDVAVIGKDEVAVTVPDRGKLIFFKVTDMLTYERELTLNGDCYGVAYSKGRLLVTFLKYPRLEILDIHGNLLKSIVYGSERFGDRLFARPDYACISLDGETLFVSDVCSRTVTSLTFDGAVKAVFKDKRLRGPRNMYADHTGNIYVFGYYSKTVHLIEVDSKKIKVILTQKDGLDKGVCSVSHCQDTNRLFVGLQEHDQIKVFQLS